jgi:type I restriction enzyme, S subunit
VSNVLPQGWEEKKLDKIIDIIHGYAFKGKDFSNNETKYILLTPGNFKISGGFKSDKFKYYSEDAFIPNNYVLNKNDLLVTMTDLSITGDTLGYPLLVPILEDKILLHNQRLGKIKFLTDEIDKYFLYYVFCTYEYRGKVLGSATGTTVRHTAPNRILDFDCKFPSDINEQKRIADILSAFDDKIELNNQMNQTLEDMATTLFKEWFENFNFPNEQDKPYKDNDGEMKSSVLGEIPIDWEVKTLDELLEITSSKRVFRSDYVESGVPFYRSKEVILKSNGQDISDCLYISNEKFEEIKSKYEIPKKGEILLTSVGTLGIPYLIQDEEFYFKDGNLTWFKNFKYKSVNFYIYLWIKYCGGKKSLDEIVIGSTQKALTINALKNIKIIFSEEIIKDFVKRVSIIMEQIQQNQQQNQTLKQQRDTLLPKLMSGEIRV